MSHQRHSARGWSKWTAITLSAMLTTAYGCSEDAEEKAIGAQTDQTGGSAGSADTTVVLAFSGAPGNDNAGGSSGREGQKEEQCGTSDVDAGFRQVNVLLVIDKSASMDQVPEGFDSSKWKALQLALDDALTAVQEELWFGVTLFPYLEAGEAYCQVPTGAAGVQVQVGSGAEQVPEILSTLTEAAPSGSTPTAAALDLALEYYTTGAGAKLEGDKVVLLATDGGPNCNDQQGCEADQCTINLEGICPSGVENCCETASTWDQCLDADATLDRIGVLRQEGIDTVVMGIPGSETYRDTLVDMAAAGSEHDYFEVTAEGGVEELTNVLIEITRELITTCELQLLKRPPDTHQVFVELDGEPIEEGSDDTWFLDTDTDPPTVMLVGSTCAQVKSQGVESVQITFGCPTEHPH